MTKRVPASIRNRNPGAQYPGKSAKLFGSTTHEVLVSKDGRHLIATFPTDEQGAAAMFDLLHRGYTGKTVEQAITKWCGGYYVGAYLQVLEGASVTKNTVLTKEHVSNPDFAIGLCQAMAKQEAGRDYPMTHEQWHDAHQMWRETVLEGWTPTNGNPTPSAEQKAANFKKRVAIAGTVGTVATVASNNADKIPAPPDLAPVMAWKGFGDAASSLGTWAVAHWWLAIPLGIVGAVIYASRRD